MMHSEKLEHSRHGITGEFRLLEAIPCHLETACHTGNVFQAFALKYASFPLCVLGQIS